MISIVIPSFNEEERIERCLASLAQQDFPRQEYEIIVVDGGSKDKTREIAEKYADLVFIQTSPKVGGARNDGALRARGEIIATTDADTILPPNWLSRIRQDFLDPEVVMLYGPVKPIEATIKNQFYLFLANSFAHIGYLTGTILFTLGCNSAFRAESFKKAGMYRVSDAGDDLEIAHRMRRIGKVKFDRKLFVSFSMRRYDQFGALKSIYEWFYIVFHGGDAEKYQYTKREYR
ncbi:glycosyltransferase [Methanospirillum hungatei]|jgi:glycosyltransferase involved in cell wall biosynthesis|uniref:glycosyltransferase n=1 Tax=Methanospirillum hungatei TaxID=2203 RepID=UPI0009D2CD03|nr:glycosyltransferase [Methanospirillum hungatei]MBP9008286.1 glycosyltransferase [Methanospirillum sp.]OQA53987.1 MAG: Glycosyltransferase AglE [Euryarchaeota archaeon ADurb.Bin294]HOW04614.1 glycosyltransferase [Methanospirillum hungatei]